MLTLPISCRAANTHRRAAVVSSNVVPACGMCQALTDQRLSQERFEARAHVRQVMLQQMNTRSGLTRSDLPQKR